ncbi:MAG: hypothetical protein RIR65_1267 [Planctomycetota bacterium]
MAKREGLPKQHVPRQHVPQEHDLLRNTITREEHDHASKCAECEPARAWKRDRATRHSAKPGPPTALGPPVDPAPSTCPSTGRCQFADTRSQMPVRRCARPDRQGRPPCAKRGGESLACAGSARWRGACAATAKWCNAEAGTTWRVARRGRWWGEADSNRRRLSQRIYSPSRLTASVSPRLALSSTRPRRAPEQDDDRTTRPKSHSPAHGCAAHGCPAMHAPDSWRRPPRLAVRALAAAGCSMLGSKRRTRRSRSEPVAPRREAPRKPRAIQIEPGRVPLPRVFSRKGVSLSGSASSSAPAPARLNAPDAAITHRSTCVATRRCQRRAAPTPEVEPAAGLEPATA